MFRGGGGRIKVDAIFPCLLDKVSVQLELGSFTLFVVAAAFAVVATVAGVVHELGLSTLPAAIHNLMRGNIYFTKGGRYGSGFGSIKKSLTLIIGQHNFLSRAAPDIRHFFDIRYPAFFDIRYPAGYPVSFAGYSARKNCFKLKHKTNKITTKHIPEPFQYVENKSEIAIRNVSRFC